MVTTSAERPPDALIPGLARIISGIDGEVVFQVSIDRFGSVMDVECLASQIQPKNMLPIDVVLEHPMRIGAASVMFVSNSSGRLFPPAEADLDFTRRLIEAGEASGVPVHDHYLVEDERYRSLRLTTDLWS